MLDNVRTLFGQRLITQVTLLYAQQIQRSRVLHLLAVLDAGTAFQGKIWPQRLFRWQSFTEGPALSVDAVCRYPQISAKILDVVE